MASAAAGSGIRDAAEEESAGPSLLGLLGIAANDGTSDIDEITTGRSGVNHLGGETVEEAETIEVIPEAPEPVAPLLPMPPPDVDALTLIEAYERRNARLAERLRDTVQAKLLLATTEASEAFKLVGADAEAATSMHEHALGELETIRTRELRSIGQDMFPGLTRMGLPGALRAMKKELRDEIEITLDLDATTDSVAGGASRSTVSPALRLVMYRFTLDSVQALTAANATACLVSLQRHGQILALAISCGEPGIGALVDRAVLAASTLAAEAHAGSVAVSDADQRFTLTLTVPASEMEPGPQVAIDDDDYSAEDRQAASPIKTVRLDDLDSEPAKDEKQTNDGSRTDTDTASERDTDDGVEDTPVTPATTIGVVLEPRTGLGAAMEALQAEFFGSTIVALNVADDVDAGREPVSADARQIVEDVVRETLRALQAADARQCDLSLTRMNAQLVLSIVSDRSHASFDGAHIEAYRDALERLGGALVVHVRGAHVAVSAEVRASSQAPEAEITLDAAPDDATQHAA